MEVGSVLAGGPSGPQPPGGTGEGPRMILGRCSRSV